MSYEKIVTLFDSAEHAESAKRNLELAGFPENEISVTSKNALGNGGQTLKEPGLWHKLFGGDIEQHEATVYGNTVDAGGVVLTLRVPQADVPKAMGILNAHQTVDVQHRAMEHGLLDVKSAAGVGAPAAAAAVATAARAAVSPVTQTPAAARTAASPVAQAPTTARAAAAPSAAAPEVAKAAAAAVSAGNRDEVIRLAEEQLSVGKRLVEEGTTRIRRFVTEKPVEEQVTLHEEHAEVVRRAVADPTSLGDIDWGEKTIEVRETAEEAVVNKTARIAEEVVVSKTGSDHVETVRDTVRRQQVEVEKIPGKGTETPKKA